MKATEQCFPVVLFIMLYEVALTFESVDEILKCDHLNESYWAVLSCGTVYYAVQSGSNFWVCGWNPMERKWKLLNSTFLWYRLLCCTNWFKIVSLRTKSPLVCHFKWKLSGISFPLMVLLVFHRFPKMKIVFSILTFVTFGKGVKIFLLGSWLIDWCQKLFIFRFWS